MEACFSEIREQDFFLTSWLNCEQYGKKQYKKKERITFILFKFYRSIDNFIHFSFYLVVKRLVTTKKSVVKIQNLVVIHKSRPVKSSRNISTQTYKSFVILVKKQSTDRLKRFLFKFSRAA